MLFRLQFKKWGSDISKFELAHTINFKVGAGDYYINTNQGYSITHNSFQEAIA